MPIGSYHQATVSYACLEFLSVTYTGYTSSDSSYLGGIRISPAGTLYVTYRFVLELWGILQDVAILGREARSLAAFTLKLRENKHMGNVCVGCARRKHSWAMHAWFDLDHSASR